MARAARALAVRAQGAQREPQGYAGLTSAGPEFRRNSRRASPLPDVVWPAAAKRAARLLPPHRAAVVFSMIFSVIFSMIFS